MSIFTGSGVALTTPFTQDGVNFDALERHLDFLVKNDTQAIIALGTTGEPSTMTEKEKHEVLDFVIDRCIGDVPVIAGAGSNNTAAAVESAKYAEKAGADAVLVVTPYYNKCSQEGLYRHYAAIADSVGIPVIAYNVPGRTGVNMQPATLARLAEAGKVAAMKEASGNISQITEMIRLCGDAIDFYSGNDDQILPVLALGGKGVISVLGNIMPAETQKLCAEYFAGNVQKAAEMQCKLNPLVSAIFSDVNPIPIKTALNMMGREMGPLRLPLCEMSEKGAAELEAVLKEFKLI